ncbi:nitroreductase family protein [Fulvivirgaceae bacterium LMO-SS25]
MLDKEVAVFNKIIENRRSVRKYLPDVQIPDDVIERSIHCATIAPNSSNLQLWEFHRVKSEQMRNLMVPMCMKQNAAKTCSELMVIVVRKDLWRKRRNALLNSIYEQKDLPEKQKTIIAKYYNKLIPIFYTNDIFNIAGLLRKITAFSIGLFKPIVREVGYADVRVTAHKSAALAAMNFMNSISAEGFDSCPMEGMDSSRIKKALGLCKKAEINMVIALGKRLPEGVYGERWRVPQSEVYFEH